MPATQAAGDGAGHSQSQGTLSKRVDIDALAAHLLSCEETLIGGCSAPTDASLASPVEPVAGGASARSAEFVCCGCRDRYRVDASLVGRVIRCRSCNQPAKVPCP